MQTALAASLGAGAAAACGKEQSKVSEESGARAFEMPERPNIVLIYSDEHRYDALGCAGNPVIHTPNIDRLASEGARFARTWCQSPICVPSRASLITGRYPHEHGIKWNKMAGDPRWPTMMKELQAAGYYTAEVGKMHFYDAASPYLKSGSDYRLNDEFVRMFGFDYAEDEHNDKYLHYSLPNAITSYGEYLKERGLWDIYLNEIKLTDPLGKTKWDGITSALPLEHDLTSYIYRNSIEWLHTYDRYDPFFLWIAPVQPHYPFADQQKWSEVYRDTQIPLGPQARPPVDDSVWGQYIKNRLDWCLAGLLTPEYVMNTARHYYGMISLVDQWIADVVQAVNDRGWADKTWFIYTSDHGDMLGDYGLMDKDMFYQVSGLVPMIIRPPKGMKAKVVDELVGSIDLTTTILELAGTNQVPGSHGRSLLPLMRGEARGREVAFSEIKGHLGGRGFFVSAATDRYRFTYDQESGASCELFDLQEDPQELRNIVNDPSAKSIADGMLNDYVLPFLAGQMG